MSTHDHTSIGNLSGPEKNAVLISALYKAVQRLEEQGTSITLDNLYTALCEELNNDVLYSEMLTTACILSRFNEQVHNAIQETPRQ